MKFSAAVVLLFQHFLRIDATGECGEVTMKEWGGEKPRSVEYLPRPVDLVIVQHTATPECSTDRQCADRVKSIQSYHMDRLHYDNIGENFLVGGNGAVYAGRGWLHAGAHTRGYNGRSVGVSFIGDFSGKYLACGAFASTR
ncbi:Peptidoglycan recognition protein [Eumeta japonica]|uniref:Peptidoglycan recognition protein n=1 Tax=Eumeta variegata TaxID=151549 RepID=A0A4C1TTU1_EUMVA|nr:Peptidoglycan recognition protein [Eumeta japonica]